MANISNEITFIVDSDDYLSSDAVKTVCYYCEKYEGNKKIAGISFLRAYPEKKEVIGKQYDETEFISNYIDCRINKKISGDKAEVFFTNILKKFPFPKFEGEMFLSEDIVWIEMAKQYDMVYINEAIYYCDYLEDGLSFNDKKVKFNSPLGSMLRGKQMMYKKIKFKTRVKGSIIYNCYKKEVKGNIPQLVKLKNRSDKLLVIITKFLGEFYNKKWKKSIK